jgi:flagellar M-ring protein FliF
MNELIALIRKAGVVRLAAVLGVGAGVAMALTLVVARIAEPSMGVLYSGLDLADAQAVVDRLAQEDVDGETKETADGVAILVPHADVSRLRLLLAGEGAAPQGGVGYELFDEQDAFGATSFQQTINRLRALEGELARTIASIAGVRSARVHLVLPERQLFSRDQEAASASIVVDSKAGLDARTVRAIVNLVASAAPGLAPARVTVLDASGQLLHSGEGDGALAADERAAGTEARLQRMVEDILRPVVGPENLRVEVSADIDFNRVTENSELIDPDSQTVLSSVTVEEAADESQPGAARGVTVANALPGAQTLVQDGPPATSANRRIEETTNYEMSRTSRTEVREHGLIKRLSVAVALNAGASPRSEQELARISALARSAIGFNEARGDRIDVVEIAFRGSPAPGAQGTEGTPAEAAPWMRFGELAALALIGLALVVFVLRPLLAPPRRIEPTAAPSGAPDGAPAALPAPQSTLARIDLSRIEGEVRASAVGRVAEAVKSHSDESAKILKGWIRQAS